MTKQLLWLIPLFAIAYGASTKLTHRIEGERLAFPGEVPYQVILYSTTIKKYFCGGVIIDKLNILTAAHCVNDKDVRSISASVGIVDTQKPHMGYMIKSAYIHDNYNASDARINNIALLKLRHPLEFSSLVSPVNITANQTVQAGSTATVSGYGLKRLEGVINKLLHVRYDIKIANHTNCQRIYKENSIKIYDTQICTYIPTRRGSCLRDSGDPLTVNGNLIGIFSWVFNCASQKYPGIFTSVVAYRQWIAEHI